MSSSNLVRLAYAKETTYGTTPAGAFQQARFTSEKMSGSPGTTKSAQIRTDRMSSGQIVTSLTVGGDLNFELAKEPALEDFMSSAMYNTWNVQAPSTQQIAIDAVNKVLTFGTGAAAQDEIHQVFCPGGYPRSGGTLVLDYGNGNTASIDGSNVESAIAQNFQTALSAIFPNVSVTRTVGTNGNGGGNPPDSGQTYTYIIDYGAGTGHIPVPTVDSNTWQNGANNAITPTISENQVGNTGAGAGPVLVVGDYIKLVSTTPAINGVVVMITNVIDATHFNFIGPATLVSGNASGSQRGDKLTIGTNKQSFSIEKAFLDLTSKAINYRGMIASQMNIDVAFGALVTGSFTFSGNDYETVEAPTDFLTSGRTINPPATTDTLNGSIDMPFLAASALGALGDSGLALKTVSLKMNNNVSAQNVIGDIAPRDYSAGTAEIDVSVDAYLQDPAWALLAKKLNQEAFALGFMVQNEGGAYGFYMPAIQVSFDDPASAGQNQDILLSMSGTAKVGANGESALSIYRF